MSMTDVATWGQLISSAAVLVTLIYLSIQTRQTATLLRSESRQSLINGDLQILRNVIDFPEIQIDMDAEDELTLEQKHRLWAHLMAFMRTREHQWLQYQNGVLDQETWAAYQKAISIALGSERCHAWWKEFGAAFDTTFVERVNAFLGEQPHYALHQRMLSWK